MVQACCDPLQDRQIEVDDVPARQDVGIERPDAGAEKVQRTALIGAALCVLRHGPIAVIHDQNFVDAGGEHGNGEQALALAVGFDVERQHARLNVDPRRLKNRIDVQPVDAIPRRPLTLDFAASLDAPIDQVPHGKADIGLKRLDICCMQPLPQLRHVLRCLHIEPATPARCPSKLRCRVGCGCGARSARARSASAARI